ncbi:MAG TPA: RagB/SusD family nutrient uptake outer membrane protein [Agriterribacter sp.]|nr:RagB/SusD family nutrient uptake outer membrane protein [Chitinophagaceae bacterium]HRP32543.1 RagB/SusD family nutrient uptake outer membrane protein [Agriterribacter sp.]
MTRRLNKLYFLLIITLGLFSCNKDFLNTKPLGEVSSEDVWKDGALTQAFVNNIYNGLGNGGFDEQMLASLSDEAVFTHTGRSINTVNEGSLSPSNTGWVSGTYSWSSMYSRIRSCNVALENIATATFDDQALKDRLAGEVHFLRAYYYHQLVRYYGGVPLIDKSYGLNEDYTIARNSFEECVNFIVKECDDAISALDGINMAKGRATANAARALKSRMLLYAASDMHDIPTLQSKTSFLSGYASPELLGYTSGDRNARWQAAKVAAKAVMDAAGSGYKLDLTAPVTPDQGRNNYMSIAMGGGSKAPGVDPAAASEIIFGRFFVAERDEGGSYQGLYNGPNGYHNWAGNTPIGLLVDDYEMMDGTKFSWSNSGQAAAPYKSRDPRLYASILYDGADWKPRDLISGNVDPANQIQTGQYDLKIGGNLVNFNGLDTRSSTIEDWNGSRTGYYVRKFIDPDPGIVDNNTRQYLPWPFFRYTEAVFNYIEACIELGEDAEAREWLNKIRFRSGMPAVTESGAALRDRYRNERRVEMSFEEQRYHDARRWLIAPTTLGRKITFISVLGKFKPGKELNGTYKHDESIYNYTYTPIIDENHEDRTWVDKMYFRPINLDEINKNDKLVQNPGYE